MRWLGLIRQWFKRTRVIVPLSEHDWEQLCSGWPLLGRLPSVELGELRELAGAFLSRKYVEGVRGLVLTTEMEWVIAVFACLPILHLGLEWYDDWNNIFVTPGSFTDVRRDYRPGGVVNESEEELSGEVLELGPVVLSWEDVSQGGQGKGYNVVIHEMAHKIDGRNGFYLDGQPPLSREAAAIWRVAFQEAYTDFCQQVARAEHGLAATERQRLARLPLDEYAAESPQEFFAVSCEAFFERPLRLRSTWPQVYECLRTFFKLDPVGWM